MATTYKVSTEPVEGNTYENKGDSGGHLTVWRLGLEEAQSVAPDGLFELHKKKGNAPPKPGDEISVKRTAEVEHNGVKGTRLYLDSGWKPGQGGGSGKRDQGEGPGARWQSKPYQSSAEHPRNEARTIHTVGLGAAPVILEQWWTAGIQQQPKTVEEYWTQFGAVVKRVRDSYQGPLERASRAHEGGQAPPAAQSSPAEQAAATQATAEVPADTTDLPPAAPVPAGGATANDDEDIPF